MDEIRFDTTANDKPWLEVNLATGVLTVDIPAAAQYLETQRKATSQQPTKAKSTEQPSSRQ